MSDYQWGFLPQWAKDKVQELTKDYHPAMNVQPVIDLVMEADNLGCEIVRRQPPVDSRLDDWRTARPCRLWSWADIERNVQALQFLCRQPSTP